MFGDIMDGELRMSAFGRLAAPVWEQSPQCVPQVDVDAWVLMPNHLHGILVIAEPCGAEGVTHSHMAVPVMTVSPLACRLTQSGDPGECVDPHHTTGRRMVPCQTARFL